MNSVKQVVFTVCVLIGANTFASAGTVPNEERGGLLYSTHCSTCHNSTIHWREKKLATDWTSLKSQVKLWQGYTKQNWSEEEIVDVTSYLNTHYYNFISPEPHILIIKK